jgi:HK97 family phage major capsid protein
MPDIELKDITTQIEAVKTATLDSITKAKSELTEKYNAAIAAGAPAAELKVEMEKSLKRLDNIQTRMDAIEAEWSRGNSFTDKNPKSVGERFVEDEEIKKWCQKGWHKGGTGMHLKSFMEFPEFFPASTKTTITSSAVGSSTPGILVPERIPGIVKPGVRRIRVRDLMPRMSTSNNAVEFVKENAFTNTASPTAETISKPESALTFSIDSATVKTVAHWIPIAKQTLDDFQTLQGYVNQRLLEGLKDVEDYELVAGDGTGQHLSGLSTEATAYDTARNVAGDTRIDKLNHAISQVEDVLLYADGIILHPRDWRAIELIKTEEGGANTGTYLMGGPAGNATPTLWGLPVAITTAVTRGTFYVGAFALYTQVWDRMAARIDISTEHADYFIRNMVAVRAEERLAFTVTRADAVIYGSF